MARTRLVALILAAAVLGAAAVVYVIARSRPFAADRAPGRVETAIARRLVRLSIPRSERDAANPFGHDQNAWRSAADHFAEHCAVCHAADGRGSSAIGSHMYPPVPDLASPAIQQFSDGALFSIIQNGVRWTGMPAFRSTDDADAIWNLVSYVRHVPALDPADLARHDSDVGGAAASTVVMDGTAFQPAEVTVRAGDVVEWVNKDPFPHSVSADTAGLHSGDLEPDRTWRYRAVTRGTFHYVCPLHPGMAGVLHVK
jgi:plastocyanin